MPEVPIDDLLRALDDAAEPDPAFAARLRSEVARVLAQRERDDDGEVLEMDVTSGDVVVAPRRPFRLLAAAAVVTIAALVGGALVLGGDDGGGNEVISADTPVDFAGGSLETVARQTGANPYYVAHASHLWTMTLGGKLTRLDPDTGEVTASTDISESSPMVATHDAVWIGNAVTGEIVRVDPESLDVTARIETGIAVENLSTRGVGLAHDMGGRRNFALLGGIDVAGDSLWVGDRGGRLLRVDTTTNEVAGTIAVDVRPDLVRAERDHVLIGDYAARTVAVVDTRTGDTVVRFGPVDTLMGADLYDGAAYVQDGKTGVVTRIDLATGDEVASAPLGASWAPGGIYSSAVRVSAAGALVETEQELVVLDPRTLERRHAFELDGHGGELFIDSDGVAWLVRYTTNEILRITPR